jgi:hypothetical protein
MAGLVPIGAEISTSGVVMPALVPAIRVVVQRKRFP